MNLYIVAMDSLKIIFYPYSKSFHLDWLKRLTNIKEKLAPRQKGQEK